MLSHYAVARVTYASNSHMTDRRPIGAHRLTSAPLILEQITISLESSHAATEYHDHL